MSARGLGFWLAAATAIAARPALAQDARDPAAAEALFVEGKTLIDAGQVEAACAKFAESQRLDPGVGILLYLGDCLEKAGRLASAWATFREAETAARQRGQRDREARAAERAAALDARLPRLRIVVPEGSRVAGLSLRRGDVALGSALWGSAVPIDPGTHHVEATAPGRSPFRADVTTKPGEITEVTIPALAAEAGPPAAATPPAPASSSPRDTRPVPEGGSTRRTTGIILGGTGVGLLAFGTVSGLLAASAWSDAEEHCDDGPPPLRCDATGVSAASATDTWGTLSTVGFALGGVALATGIVLYATAPDDVTSARLEVRAEPERGGVGVRAGGRF